MYQTIHTASVKTTTPVQNKPRSASSLIWKLLQHLDGAPPLFGGCVIRRVLAFRSKPCRPVTTIKIEGKKAL